MPGVVSLSTLATVDLAHVRNTMRTPPEQKNHFTPNTMRFIDAATLSMMIAPGNQEQKQVGRLSRHALDKRENEKCFRVFATGTRKTADRLICYRRHSYVIVVMRYGLLLLYLSAPRSPGPLSMMRGTGSRIHISNR